MSNKEIIYGFGVNPNLTTNHFYIIIPSKNNENYTVGYGYPVYDSITNLYSFS